LTGLPSGQAKPNRMDEKTQFVRELFVGARDIKSAESIGDGRCRDGRDSKGQGASNGPKTKAHGTMMARMFGARQDFCGVEAVQEGSAEVGEWGIILGVEQTQ